MTRYFLQYGVPLLIFALVVVLGSRLRSRGDVSEGERDRTVFLLLFIGGALVATVLGFLFYQYLET
ncbi:MAG: hypothetical protein AAF648_00730 [Pseudomonadota bacterium]